MNINIIEDNKKLDFKDENADINIASDKNLNIDFNVEGNVNLFLHVEAITNKVNLNIYVNTHTSIKINNFISGNNTDFVINIIFLGEFSNVEYNSSFIGNVTKIININHNYNNTNSIVNIKGVNNKNNIKLTIIEKVEKKINNCNIVENSKIINILDSKSYIEPILLIDSNEVSASHSSIIKNIDNDYIEYFESRGISMKEAIKLIKEGFLLEFFDNYQKKYIKEKNYEY